MSRLSTTLSAILALSALLAMPVAGPVFAQAGAAPAAEAIAPADIAAFARGLAAENARLESLADAPPDTDADAETRAAQAALGMQEALLAGAEAAGMPLARYGAVKRQVYEVLRAVNLNALVDETLVHVNASSLDEEAREQLRSEAEALRAGDDPYAGLPRPVAAALRAREAELMELRTRNIHALARVAARGA
jgi:hypothetical protein